VSTTDKDALGIAVPGIVGREPDVRGPGPETQEELTFERKPMVGWFDPSQLLRTAVRAVLSDVFGQYADKREMQSALSPPGVHDYTDLDEVWIDFVADLGDGFDSTYSIAWLLSRKTLPFEGLKEPTQRGRILVMGGDQVYPTASREEYNDRMAGPYEAALPCVIKEPPPHLFAIPGNHDWYDGLTSFIRLFCQNRWIGGWETRQKRSYFALKLSHGWWLWGTDIALEADIDKPQLDYFKDVAKCHMTPGDRVILCTAEPSWVFTGIKDLTAFDNVEFFEREVIRKYGHTLGVTLTGDMHHYARYAREDGSDQKITSGGGGAYLVSTHHLPDTLTLPQRKARDGARFQPQVEKLSYRREKAYPPMELSRGMVAGARHFRPLNTTFAALVAGFYAACGSVAAFWMRPTTDVTLGLLRLAAVPLLLLLVAAIVFGLTGLCRLTPRISPRRALRIGALHALPHLAVIFAAAAALNAVADRFGLLQSVPLMVAFSALVLGAMAVLGYWLGGRIVGEYLRIADGYGVNTNESFAAQRIEDFKNFVRLHIDRSGTLTVYPIGVERINREWKFSPAAAPGLAFYEPGGAAPRPHLIEDPIVIPGRPAAA
jgi:hypothetical protein